MPSKTKFLMAMAAIIALLVGASSAQAQRGTVGIIQNKAGAVEGATEVAVNETSGDVYVIDGAVDVYDSSGNFLFKFSNGAGDDFFAPIGIAINQSTGNVYISEARNNVEVFDSAGNFLSKLDGLGRNRLAVDSASGDIYLTGYVSRPTGDGSDLRVYDSTGHFLRKSGWDVDAVNPSTGFEVCTASSGHECKDGTIGAGAGQFGAGFNGAPSQGSVAVNESTGSTYAVDSSNNRVQVFDSSGDYKFQFGSQGSGNGQFSLPTAISIDQGTGDVTVFDAGNRRIETFDSSGSYKSQLSLPEGTGDGEFRRIPDLTFDHAKGRLYLLDPQSHRVQALDAATGSFVLAFGQGVDQTTGGDTCTAASGDVCRQGTSFSGIAGLAVNDTTGDLYALTGDDVLIYDEGGSFLRRFGIQEGPGAGQLGGGPAGIGIDQATGAAYVLDAANNRVSKFDSTGNFLFSFGWDVNQTQAGSGLETCPRPGKPADVCQAGEEGAEPGQIGGAPEISTQRMAASGIAVSTDGNVYVSEPGYWEASNGVYYGNRRVQVFGPNGSLISTFTVPHDPPGCLPGGLHDCLDNVEPYRLAVNSTGDILTTPDPQGFTPVNTCRGSGGPTPGTHACLLKQFSPGGAYMGTFASTETFGRLFQVAIDPSNDHAYVYQASNPEEQQYEVAVYDSSGGPVEQVALGLPKPYIGSSSSGLAVRSGTSRAYVSDGKRRIFVLDTLATLPAATINSPSNVTSSAASFSGSANLNTNAFGGGYHFEYRQVGATAWKEVASEVPLSPGTSPVPANQGISGLEPNTSYQARLIVTREVGGGSATSAIQSFTTGAEAPRISLVDANLVTETTSTLKAYIDPRKSPTSYFFEYGTDESYGTVVPLSENGDAGAQLGPEGVLEQIEGLQPETTYHFRVTATNQAGTVHSDDAAFTTRTSAEMNWPARGLELVNEPQKGTQNATLVREEPSSEGGVLGFPGIDRAGNRSAWLTTSGAPGSTTGAGAPFLSERTGTGWVTRPLTPAAAEQPGEGMREYERPVAATPDLSTFAFITTHGILSPAEHALVRVETGGGVLRHQIIEVQPPDTPVGHGFGPGTSLAADGTLIYGKGTGLNSNQAVKGEEIFIVRSDGVAQKLPTPACEATLLAGAKESFSRLLLLSAGDTNCNGPKQLYSLEPQSGQLELISGPPASGPAAAADKDAARISDDGSTVIYRTATAISADDTDGITDLYRWQAGSGNECVTCAAGGLGPSSTHTSKDLSHIYINTSSKLVPGTPGGLYVWHDGEIHFISPNAGMDLVTPDGRTVVFWAGVKGITADRLDACRDTESGADISHESINPCSQLYLYSEQRGTIECISCPAEPQEAGVQPELGGAFKGFNYALADDGQTVGFVTGAALSPRDINNAPDVYEWHNGSVRLVTNGASEWPENLFARPQVGGISADGRDLVLSVGGTALSGHEADGFVNIYDARVGGGFAVELPPAPCVEDACQGPLQSAPPLSNPGSAAFNGQGNAAAHHLRRHEAKHKKKKHSRHAKQRRGANHNRGGAK